MNDRSALALSVENALRESDGLGGIFADYTKQINAILPIFDSYRNGVLREAHDAIRADLTKMPTAPLWSPGMSYQQGMDWAARVVDQLREAGGAP